MRGSCRINTPKQLGCIPNLGVDPDRTREGKRGQRERTRVLVAVVEQEGHNRVKVRGGADRGLDAPGDTF